MQVLDEESFITSSGVSDWEPDNPSSPTPVNRSSFYQIPSQRKYKRNLKPFIYAGLGVSSLILVIALGIFAYSQYDSAGAGVVPEPANGKDAVTFPEEAGATADFGSWFEYKTTTGRFAIHFPSEPEVKNSPSGIQARVDAGGGVLWSVVYYDTKVTDPDMYGGPEKHLDRQVAVSAKRATLMALESDPIEGHTARQYLLKSETQVRYVRSLFIDGRVYYLTWSGPEDQVHPLDVRAFFESFRVVQE